MPSLLLHYAPDNASLCIRLALLVQGVPFETRLVDRRRGAHKSPAYLALNPHGLIPVLETPDGPLFETGAILLWLDDAHGGLLPPRGTPGRGRALSWLFWLSNTLHPALRTLFYPQTYLPQAPAMMADAARERITALLDLAEREGLPPAAALDCYLCPMLRWPALYPEAGSGWFDLARWPGLYARAAAFEVTAATRDAARAEGLGPRPFTDPRLPDPPEGSAT